MQRPLNLASLFLTLFLLRIASADELLQVPAAIHIASKVSDGKYSIPEIASLAKENNIKVLIITDHALMRWQYGLWPLRNVVKRTVEQKSVFKYGIRHYLEEIKKAQASNPDLVLIPGIEAAPFYYWTGSIFDRSLKIHSWHKHLLVIGLEKASDYEQLPVIGNDGGLRKPPGIKDVFNVFLSGLAVFLGVLLLRERKFRYRDSGRHQVKPYRVRKWLYGIAFIIVGALFLLNGYPFYGSSFDQYHGDKGVVPYQDLIDYANSKGAMTFWPHPEAPYVATADNIGIETPGYASDLEHIDNYTGFAVFYEGYEAIGRSAGLWDDILLDYCEGKRKTAVWALAGLSFDSIGNLRDHLKAVRTVLLVRQLNKTESLRALREGRMYALAGRLSGQFILDNFMVRDQARNVAKTMGEELTIQEKPLIEISGRFLGGQDEILNIKLIRSGSVIQAFEVRSPFHIFYTDDIDNKPGCRYYRVEITSPSLALVSNPIFVKHR